MLLPAVDIADGRTVRLDQGRSDTETIRGAIFVPGSASLLVAGESYVSACGRVGTLIWVNLRIRTIINAPAMAANRPNATTAASPIAHPYVNQRTPSAEVRRHVTIDAPSRSCDLQADVDDDVRPGLTEAEQEKLREIKRRNRVLEEENLILRRAAAFFAKDISPK